MSPLQLALVVLGSAALGLLLAGWVGYPVALRLLRPATRRPAEGPGSDWRPDVDVIIATRDAVAAVEARVRDILEADYPDDRLRVVVAVDTAGPVPVKVYQGAFVPETRVQVVSGDGPGGKAAALNAACRAARGEVLVFTDTAQRFDRAAIDALVRCLGTTGAAGASGYLRARGDRGALGLFWNYETMVRQLESDFDSLVGVTGAIYALRRDAWQDLRAGLINDDLVVPLLARRAGRRVVQCPQALAEDHRTFTREQQYRRRVRTLSGIYQLLAWYPWVRWPWSNPLWVQFALHKGVRLFTPFLAALAAGGSVLALGWRAAVVAGSLAGLLLLVLALLRKIHPAQLGTELLWAVRLGLAAPLEAARNARRGNWDLWHPPGADGQVS